MPRTNVGRQRQVYGPQQQYTPKQTACAAAALGASATLGTARGVTGGLLMGFAGVLMSPVEFLENKRLANPVLLDGLKNVIGYQQATQARDTYNFCMGNHDAKPLYATD